MTEKEFLNRYDSGDHFNNKELAFLLHEFPKIETTFGRTTQNSKEVRTVVSIGCRYFLINWYMGLGYCYNDDFYCSPMEVRKKVKTVIEWEEI